jgi:hypothetical protein
VWVEEARSCDFDHWIISSSAKNMGPSLILSKGGHVRIVPVPLLLRAYLRRLGEKDQAFGWLEKAYQEYSQEMTLSLLMEPAFDSLRSDRRFPGSPPPHGS